MTIFILSDNRGQGYDKVKIEALYQKKRRRKNPGRQGVYCYFTVIDMYF
jgi:hypothetical protein